MNTRIEGLLAVAVIAALALALAGDATAQCPRMPPKYNPGDVVSQPSGPSTPGPSGPSTPSPGSPSTGTPRGPSTLPGASVPVGGFTPRGTPMVFARSQASREALDIEWDYPVPEDQQQAMSFATALAAVAGADRRPLIVLRECYRCEDPNFALLNRTMDNERTLVMTRWFHCVKLTDHVRHADHAFHRLFEQEHPPHLFLTDAEGKEVYPFDGYQRQGDLWKAMTKLLRKTYQHDAGHAVKKIGRLLEEYDRLEGLELTLRDQYDRVLEKQGPRSARLQNIEKKLAGVREQMGRARTEEKRISDLGLRKPASAGTEPR